MKLARLNGEAEIFHSIQGEGPTLGVPSVFIRLSLCNLHCRWCDTDYTWNWEGTPWEHDKDADPAYRKFNRAEAQIELTPREVARRALAFECSNFILTGGEPLLQPEALEALIGEIRSSRPEARFEVETNGTRDPGPPLWRAIDQFNVSPKLSNSNNDSSQRLVPEVLKAFADSDKSWFKFVISQPHDLDEVRELERDYQLPRQRIILMPEGTSPEALQSRHLWLADQCRDHGYRLGDRLHVKLWGARRGV